MTLDNPYKRIARPFDHPRGPWMIGSIHRSYLLNSDFAVNRTSAIRAYHTIEKDLRQVFDFIEPDNRNLTTFSTRLYEIFLRASTEFESNCKLILSENVYSCPSHKRNLDITDYKRINEATHLSEYQIALTIWADVPLLLNPLSPWSTDGSLDWYQKYNTVKHNRSSEFHLANLKNTIDAVAALFIILFAQFNVLAFSSHELVEHLNDVDGWLTHHNSIFWVKVPINWSEDQCYSSEPTSMNETFNQFNFNPPSQV
ncbi:MAG: hypothetical protein WCP16_22325 [Pseudanabaena sp. ELA645]|jgi:hypothetical protein